MKKNKTVKIFAILGLLGIIVSVVGTGILVLTSQNAQQQVETFQYDKNTISQEDVQKLIDQNKVEVKTGTGENK